MPRLPDVTELGGRPVPRTTGGIASYRPTHGAETAPGEALAGLGRTISGIGDFLEKEQQHSDKVRVEDEFNKVRNYMIDLKIGDDGFTQRKGSDAVNKPLLKDYSSRFESFVKDIESGLESDEQRKAFSARAAIAGMELKQGILSHVAQERESYDKQVYDSTINIELQNSSLSWRDPNAVALSTERIKSAVEEEADHKGWAKEVTELELTKQLSRVHLSVIDQAISAGSSDYAKLWYSHNKSEIDPTIHSAIEDKLKVAGIKEVAQEATEDLVSRYESETDALKEARKRFKGDEEDAVVQRLKVRYSEKRQVREENRRLLTRSAWDVIKRGGTPDDLSAEQLNSLDGSTISSMWNFLRTKDKRVTDLDKWDEFERLLQAGDITERDQVRDYEQYFSPQDSRTAMKAFEKRGEVPTTDLKRAYIDRVGKSQAKWSKKEREQWLGFQDYMLTKVKETRRPEDVDVWADRWFMSGKTIEDRWGFDPATLGEAVVSGREQEFLFDVPEEHEPDVRAAMRHAGAPDNVSKAFYTQHYLPALDYLRARDIAINPRTVAAIAVLRANGKPVTPANIDYVAGQIQ